MDFWDLTPLLVQMGGVEGVEATEVNRYGSSHKDCAFTAAAAPDKAPQSDTWHVPLWDGVMCTTFQVRIELAG